MKFSFKKGNKYGVGRIPWNKGLKGIHLSVETEFKMGRLDSKHPEWKGDKASYHAIHAWVRRWKGIPVKCSKCGLDNPNKLHWANKDHSYKRRLNDYISLCRRCHFAYDVKFNGKLPLVSYTKRCQK